MLYESISDYLQLRRLIYVSQHRFSTHPLSADPRVITNPVLPLGSRASVITIKTAESFRAFFFLAVPTDQNYPPLLIHD